MGALIAILMMVLFWWAMIVGFKTLARRFFAFVGGAVGSGNSYGQERRLLHSGDEDIPERVDSLTDEMERALASERASATELVAQATQRQQMLSDAEKAVADWDDKAKLAVDKGRDDLARAAISERQNAAKRADNLREEIARIDDLLRGYQVEIRTLQTRLAEIYRRQSFAAARIDRAENSARAHELLSGDKWEEALPGFDSLDREADMAEARAEALTLGAPRGFGRKLAAPAPTLSALTPLPSADPRIEAELAELKARMANKS